MLDARLPAQAMLVISAACEQDSPPRLGCGIARAFAEAGHRTALVSLYEPAAGESAANAVLDELATWGGGIHYAPRALMEMSAFIRELRSMHDIVVVVAPPVPRDPISLQISRMADGVLLAVRLGRKITADDEHTVTQLQRVSASLLGVVAVQHEIQNLNARFKVAVGSAQPLEAALN
jgi:Mrp family chromosome partitioning ATPase